MSPSTIKLIGLILLIPAVVIGVIPVLAMHTHVLYGMRDFKLTLGSLSIVDYHHDVNGEPVATAWRGVWAIAILGELLLIAVHVIKPRHNNRHKIEVKRWF